MANFIKEWTSMEIESLTRSYKRYSNFISLLKYALPIFVLVLIIVMFLFSESVDGPKNIPLEPIEATETSKKTTQIMEKPRFHGVDSNNQPYNIFAKSASQETKDKVALHEVNADISTNDGAWISLVADGGNYNITREFLELTGQVGIFMTEADFSGYELDTKLVDIDIKNRIAKGENIVHVKSDIGDFKATGFVMDMNLEKITFMGPIKLVIYDNE